MLEFRSVLPEVQWPAIPSSRSGQLLGIQFQLEQSQWLTAAELELNQQRQLARVVAHAAATVPFYRDRLAAVIAESDDQVDLATWRQVPLLTRRQVQAAGDRLLSNAYPASHGQQVATHTSGSTGEPVSTTGTTVTRLMWNAITLRQHLWHRRVA